MQKIERDNKINERRIFDDEQLRAEEHQRKRKERSQLGGDVDLSEV